MRSDITRRSFVATGLTAFFMPGFAQAQTVTTIDGKTYQGTRAANGVLGEGGEGLRAKSNMVISNCQFLDLGNGAIRINVPTDNLTIENCQANNLYRFLEDTSSVSTNPASLTNFTIKGVTAREVDHSMTRIRYTSNGGVIEDSVAYASSQCDAYCVGFQLDDQAYGITYTRVESHGFREVSTPPTSYWNGDGFSDERGNHDIRYMYCTATECSDGGFDLKSAGVYLEGCVSRLNKRNYRLWSSGQLLKCTSEDPHLYGGTGGAAHFCFHTAASTYVIDQPVVRASAGNSAPIFLIATDAPLNLEIRNADIDAPDAPLFMIEGPEPVITWVPDRAQQNIHVLRDRA